MRVLIGCATSCVALEAFLALAHDAWQCDIEPAERQTNRHIQDDIRNVIGWGWDLMILSNPPCTRLCNSGVRWLHEPPPTAPREALPVEQELWAKMDREARLSIMWRLLDEGADLFSACWNAPIPCIAVENPVMHKHAKARIDGYQPFAQSVHPWHFADSEDGPDNVKKRTCLWLKNLPALTRTGTVDGSTARPAIHHASPGEDRARIRSRTFPGMAAAWADQWGAAALDAIHRAA